MFKPQEPDLLKEINVNMGEHNYKLTMTEQRADGFSVPMDVFRVEFSNLYVRGNLYLHHIEETFPAPREVYKEQYSKAEKSFWTLSGLIPKETEAPSIQESLVKEPVGFKPSNDKEKKTD